MITGAGGQFSRALLRALGGLPLIPWTHGEADVAEPDIVARLERLQPRAIVHRAQRERRFEVVTDQVGSPTLPDDLAKVIRQVLEKGILGLFHAAGEGWCTRYELAQAIVAAVRPGVELVPVETVPGSRPARRPANAALSTGALRAKGITLRPWRDALAAFLTSHPSPHAL